MKRRRMCSAKSSRHLRARRCMFRLGDNTHSSWPEDENVGRAGSVGQWASVLRHFGLDLSWWRSAMSEQALGMRSSSISLTARVHACFPRPPYAVRLSCADGHTVSHPIFVHCGHLTAYVGAAGDQSLHSSPSFHHEGTGAVA